MSSKLLWCKLCGEVFEHEHVCKPMQNEAAVNRFEVIDHRDNGGGGRTSFGWNVSVRLSYQDGGRTLKVFVTDRRETDEPVA
jgi:hypothetical protein